MGCSTIPYFGYGKKTARSKGSRLLTRETDRSLRFFVHPLYEGRGIGRALGSRRVNKNLPAPPLVPHFQSILSVVDIPHTVRQSHHRFSQVPKLKHYASRAIFHAPRFIGTTCAGFQSASPVAMRSPTWSHAACAPHRQRGSHTDQLWQGSRDAPGRAPGTHSPSFSQLDDAPVEST
jgi:hypothetical protein